MQEKTPLKLALLIAATLVVDAITVQRFLDPQDEFRTKAAYFALAFGHVNIVAIWLGATWSTGGLWQQAWRIGALAAVVLLLATVTYMRATGIDDWASYVALFAIPAALTTIFVVSFRAMARRRRGAHSAGERRFQYSVRFLLLLMTAVALVSGLAGKANYFWQDLGLLATGIGNAVAVAAAAYGIARLHILPFFRLALLLAVAIVCGLVSQGLAAKAPLFVVELNLIQAFFLAAWLRWGNILPSQGEQPVSGPNPTSTHRAKQLPPSQS